MEAVTDILTFKNRVKTSLKDGTEIWLTGIQGFWCAFDGFKHPVLAGYSLGESGNPVSHQFTLKGANINNWRRWYHLKDFSPQSLLDARVLGSKWTRIVTDWLEVENAY